LNIDFRIKIFYEPGCSATIKLLLRRTLVRLFVNDELSMVNKLSLALVILFTTHH